MKKFLLSLLLVNCSNPGPLAQLHAGIDYSPKEVDFPDTVYGQSQTLELTVVNTGTGDLHLQMALADPAHAFQVSLEDLAVKAGDQTNLSIIFTPTLVGPLGAELVFSFPEPYPGYAIVKLSGQGLGNALSGEGEGEGETPSEGEGEGEGEGEQGCITINDCQSNDQVCGPDHICRQLCRQATECSTGNACEPLPGSVSLGFCSIAGARNEGQNCTDNSQCKTGLCTENGTCRVLCQHTNDCGSNEECGGVFYHDQLGRRMTTACIPPDGRQNLEQSCLLDESTASSDLCLTASCDMIPWYEGLANDAICTPICSGSSDCASDQLCGIVYDGNQESPAIESTQGSGRYTEAFTGCYTAADFDSFTPGEIIYPGPQQLGQDCDATSESGDFQCRSNLCARFDPIVGKCTDFCQKNSDCNSIYLPGMHCSLGEINFESLFLQGAALDDSSAFVLVGVCSL